VNSGKRGRLLPAAWLLALLIFQPACRDSAAPPPETPASFLSGGRSPSGGAMADGTIRLRDVTEEETGIAFVHTDGSSGRRYIVEAMSAGLALFDYDGDGLIDIYFLSGSPLQGAEVDVPPTNALYRNEGGWRFTDVTEQAGVGDAGYGLGVAVGDYDNDGDPDLYVSNFGPNVLYRNNGDGSFSDVTDLAGVGNGSLMGAGASFLDIEGDGDLDLYVGNYIEFRYDLHINRLVDGVPMYPVPRDYDPVPDALFRNDGDGTFTDISVESGVAACAGTSMGMVCADADDDGDTDVFVVNDVAQNFFFVNDGRGHFEEGGGLVGVAYNIRGDENGSMGVDCGDYDNDGRLDFFMTSYQGELPVLYRNIGHGLLEDVTEAAGAGHTVFAHVNWGAGLVDFDNDGDRDIFVANGHTEDNIELRDRSTGYRVRNTLLMNRGDGRFVDVSDTCGDGLSPVCASRGAAFDDLDNDGDVDAVIVNSRQAPTILRNDSREENHWLQVRLQGTRTNRDGVGARVRVVAGDLTQVAEVHGGRGYQSHFGSRLQFGLGQRDCVDRIEVRWIGGESEVFEGCQADKRLTLVEGTGEPVSEALLESGGNAK
jgi:enediyne biosynthesis protein E4